MIHLLKSLVTIVASLINFVIHSISSLINLFFHIPQYLSFITTSLDVLPAVILPFALATVSIYAVYFILNRQ